MTLNLVSSATEPSTECEVMKFFGVALGEGLASCNFSEFGNLNGLNESDIKVKLRPVGKGSFVPRPSS